MHALVSLLLAVAPHTESLNGVTMQRVRDGVYVESPASADEHATILRDVDAAYAQLHRAFGPEPSFSAVVLVCRTAACKLAFGATVQAAGAADLGFAAVDIARADKDRVVVVTGPNSFTARVLAHELVHAITKSWAPYDSLPTWLNEGVATAIADEPSCRGFAAASEIDVTSLITKTDWQQFIATTGETRRTYCQARFAAEAWASFADIRELGERVRARCTTK